MANMEGVKDPDIFPPPPFTVYVVLTCDARLQEPTRSGGGVPTRTPEMTEVGSERLCSDPFAVTDDATMRTQIYPLLIADGADTHLTGRPVASWTASGGGHRVARAPALQFGGYTWDTCQGHVSEELTAPADTSSSR